MQAFAYAYTTIFDGAYARRQRSRVGQQATLRRFDFKHHKPIHGEHYVTRQPGNTSRSHRRRHISEDIGSVLMRTLSPMSLREEEARFYDDTDESGRCHGKQYA